MPAKSSTPRRLAWPRRLAFVWLVAAPPLLLPAAEPRRAAALPELDSSLQTGIRVAVKGRLLPDGALRADEVELKPGGDVDQELQGPVRGVDREGSTFQLLGQTVRVRSSTRYTQDGDVAATFEDVRVGILVKVDGRRDDEGRLVAEKVRIRGPAKGRERAKIEGRIEVIRPSTRGAAELRVAGLDVVLSEGTGLVGPKGRERPIMRQRVGVVDDDDLLFTRGTRLGAHVTMAGEVRLRGEYLSNFDLDAETDDDEVVPEVTGTMAFAADLGRVFAYATLVGGQTFTIRGDVPFEEAEGDVRVGEAYIQTALARWLAVVVGRQRFNEEREWYYNTRNLDAVRLIAEAFPVTLEASVSRDLFDESHNQRDQDRVNTILQLRYDAAKDLRFEAYFIDRNDRTELDDSPRMVGLRLLGEPGRHVEFWADLARETGTVCERVVIDGGSRFVSGRRCSGVEVPGGFVVRDVRAHAYDLGLTWRPRVGLDPSFTVAYARGSGEGDGIREMSPEEAASTTATSFRQTGLHRNRWKYNGVVSFRYYGEVAAPELFNLGVLTLGVGLRPTRAYSIDLMYHDYRQDVASRSYHDFQFNDRPSGDGRSIGREWDLAFGYEPSRNLELRLTAGVFEPGDALAVDATTAAAVRFQSKFRF